MYTLHNFNIPSGICTQFCKNIIDVLLGAFSLRALSSTISWQTVYDNLNICIVLFHVSLCDVLNYICW